MCTVPATASSWRRARSPLRRWEKPATATIAQPARRKRWSSRWRRILLTTSGLTPPSLSPVSSSSTLAICPARKKTRVRPSRYWDLSNSSASSSASQNERESIDDSSAPPEASAPSRP